MQSVPLISLEYSVQNNVWFGAPNILMEILCEWGWPLPKLYLYSEPSLYLFKDKTNNSKNGYTYKVELKAPQNSFEVIIQIIIRTKSPNIQLFLYFLQHRPGQTFSEEDQIGGEHLISWSQGILEKRQNFVVTYFTKGSSQQIRSV